MQSYNIEISRFLRVLWIWEMSMFFFSFAGPWHLRFISICNYLNYLSIARREVRCSIKDWSSTKISDIKMRKFIMKTFWNVIFFKPGESPKSSCLSKSDNLQLSTNLKSFAWRTTKVSSWIGWQTLLLHVAFHQPNAGKTCFYKIYLKMPILRPSVNRDCVSLTRYYKIKQNLIFSGLNTHVMI